MLTGQHTHFIRNERTMDTSEKKHVVVVNDDPLQLKIIMQYLVDGGMEVSAFTSAEEALEHMSGSGAPDVLVTDLYMPGIDGWGLCRLMQSEDYPDFNEVPILIISATFAGVQAREIAADLGVKGFLPIPFKPERLVEYVKTISKGANISVVPKCVIIDCDETLSNSMKKIFEKRGYTVFNCKTVKEGRILLNEHKPEVVVLDYCIPDGNALELIGEFKKPGFLGVVIMTTADPNPRLATLCVKQGADAYIRKPFDPEYLLTVSETARRERSLFHIKELLEVRTRELRNSEKRFRTLFKGIPEIVIVHNNKGIILDCNKNVEQLMGKTFKEVVEIGFNASFSDENADKYLESMEKSRIAGTYSFEIKLQTSSQQILYAGIRMSLIEYEREIIYLVIISDITNLKSEERTRMSQEKLKGVLEMAGATCHELNQPLQAVSGNAELLLMDIGDNHPLYETLVEIRNETAKMASITKKLNNITRYEVKEYLMGTSIIDIEKASEKKR
ncbi:response regulator [bacterium]|nr:response regulator [bacterium]